MTDLEALEDAYKRIEKVEGAYYDEQEFMDEHGFPHESAYIEAKRSGVRQVMNVIADLMRTIASRQNASKVMKELRSKVK